MGKRAKRRLRGRFFADRRYARRRWSEERAIMSRDFDAARAAAWAYGDALHAASGGAPDKLVAMYKAHGPRHQAKC